MYAAGKGIAMAPGGNGGGGTAVVSAGGGGEAGTSHVVALSGEAAVSGGSAGNPLSPRTLGACHPASSGCAGGSASGIRAAGCIGAMASGTVMVTLGSSAGACEHPNTVQPPFSA